MPLITQTVSQDYLDMYDGYDTTKVGAGLVTPDIYATPSYSKKKIRNLVIGGISEIVYSGYEHDQSPMVIPMQYEPRYNTIIGINLNYAPASVRKNILKYILEANAARIKGNQPLMINYDSLKRLVPQVRGMIRRYKVVLIRPVETYQLNEWPEVLKKRSRWEKMYRGMK